MQDNPLFQVRLNITLAVHSVSFSIDPVSLVIQKMVKRVPLHQRQQLPAFTIHGLYAFAQERSTGVFLDRHSE